MEDISSYGNKIDFIRFNGVSTDSESHSLSASSRVLHFGLIPFESADKWRWFLFSEEREQLPNGIAFKSVSSESQDRGKTNRNSNHHVTP